MNKMDKMDKMDKFEQIYLIGKGYLVNKLKPFLIKLAERNNLKFEHYSNSQNCSVLNGSLRKKLDFKNTLLIFGEFHSTQYNSIHMEELDFLLKYQAIEIFAKKSSKFNNKIIFLNSMKSILKTKRSEFDKLYIKYNKKVLKLSKKYKNVYNILLPYIIDIDILDKPNTIFEKIKNKEITEKDLNNDLIPLQIFNQFQRKFTELIDEILIIKYTEINIFSFEYKYIFAKDFINLYYNLKEKYEENNK